MQNLFRDEGAEYAGAMIDLTHASRDDLIRLVIAEHETIQRQERVILASLFGTWRVRGETFPSACLTVRISPQP